MCRKGIVRDGEIFERHWRERLGVHYSWWMTVSITAAALMDTSDKMACALDILFSILLSL